ncbi:MAG: beta-ketoacyl synthase chain length factor [Oscillospiraceae bacterium]|jgi:hypothetical protein|nr:beta-ketoacyl synthase chain length factor [Oscillospiraceae bacterium]
MAYINGIGSITIQNQEQLVIPDISAYIPPMLARRMSTIVKRAIVSSKMALTDAALEMPDAIIAGTGLGCIEDTEKFLISMIQNNETLLQPTHFIQSTHNTISSQIAMLLKCYGYNNTYSHLGISFESALLDAFLQIQTGACQNVLVGGYDEMTPNYHLMLSKNHFWDGCFSGEGCISFVVSNQQNQHSYCKIEAIELFYRPKSTEETKDYVFNFLKNKNLTKRDLDAVMLGYSGNQKNDSVYNAMSDFWGNLPRLTYRQFSGEFFTATAFGIKFAAQMLKTQIHSPIHRIIFHQHFQNNTHALILLSVC